MATEQLPGWPKKALVKRVRSHLWVFGIRPRGEPWRLAWKWAYDISQSYYHPRWPLPSEIASQYVLLLLHHMKASVGLKLPYRADTVMPNSVQQLLSVSLDLTMQLKLEHKE